MATKINTNGRHMFAKGKAYFVRTVTHHYLGIVREVLDLCIVMDHCSWIADNGRFHSLMNGEWDSSSEREPYGAKRRVMVFYGAMLDAVEWEHEVPDTVK